MSQTLHCVKKLDYPCNCKSELSIVCNVVKSHCLQAMKIVRHHANGRFDWLISGHQRVNPSREAISVLSGKYKTFTFVHPVLLASIIIEKMMSFYFRKHFQMADKSVPQNHISDAH